MAGKLDALFDKVEETLTVNSIVIAEAISHIPPETMQSAREHLAERLSAKRANRSQTKENE